MPMGIYVALVPVSTIEGGYLMLILLTLLVECAVTCFIEDEQGTCKLLLLLKQCQQCVWIVDTKFWYAVCLNIFDVFLPDIAQRLTDVLCRKEILVGKLCKGLVPHHIDQSCTL